MDEENFDSSLKPGGHISEGVVYPPSQKAESTSPTEPCGDSFQNPQINTSQHQPSQNTNINPQTNAKIEEAIQDQSEKTLQKNRFNLKGNLVLRVGLFLLVASIVSLILAIVLK